MARRTLEAILAEADEFGLRDVKAPAAQAASESSRVSQQFQEINGFVDRHGFPPGGGPSGRKASVNERALAIRLRAYQESAEIRGKLLPLDRHGLLKPTAAEEPVPQSLDDILSLGDGLLSTPADDIFSLRHAGHPSGIARPDKVSERRKCPDFERFRPLFDACAADLRNRIRTTLPFANEQEIRAGQFFILGGVMVFVAEVNAPHIRSGKRNARLRLVFENGTEGENLLRSLATQLYKDPGGRRISDPESGPLFEPEPTTASVAAPEQRVTGCLYVVRSLSSLPTVKRLDGGLFKIGFTTGRFEERIARAQEDPTFLLAPVHPVRTYGTVDLNANKVENLLHRFFDAARLDIEIMDRFGKPFRPREWFLLPLPVIEQAVRMLLDGSIVRHRYDSTQMTIVPNTAA